jgi:hypothetical protein
MDFFVENKWFFMVGTEILFWVFTIAFGLIRYLFGRDRLSLVALALLFVNELCLVLLAVLDYRETGEIAAFQIATIAFILYVLAYGRQDFKHVDGYLKRKLSAWKGESSPRSAAASE